MSKKKFVFLAISIMLAMPFIISCSDKDGSDGKDGVSCTLKDNDNGTGILTCGEDSFVIQGGKDGKDGVSCILKENGNGTVTLTCGEDSFIIQGGKDGEDGVSCILKENGNEPVKIICGDAETIIPLCSRGIYNPATQVCEIDFSEFTEEEAKVLIRMQNPKNRVSVDEAVEQANWVIDFLNNNDLGTNRRINSVSALASDDIEFTEVLRYNGIEVPDTLKYNFQYEVQITPYIRR